MKRLYSLKGRTIFRSIFQDGIRYQKRGIRVFINRSVHMNTVASNRIPSAGRDIRIGIALSKRLGKAHDRNWVKRRIRAICRDLMGFIQNNTCIIIRVEKEALHVSYAEQKRIIRSLFDRAGITHQ